MKAQQTRAVADGGESLQSIAEQLTAAQHTAASKGTAPPDAAGSCRAAAAAKLWAAVLQCNDQAKQDLLKLLPCSHLLGIMEGTQRDAKAAYAAAGCLACLAAHPQWMAELTATSATTNRVVAAATGLLLGDHDRSRVPAMQLLLALSRCPMQVALLAPVLPALLSLLAAAGGPGWAGGRGLAASAAGVLAALLAPSECEAAEQQQARRLRCLSGGAVPSLLRLLLQRGPAGPALLPAAACLRFLALAPGAAEVMAGDAGVAAQLLALLGPAGTPAGGGSAPLHPGVAAYVAGVVWELGAAPAAAQQLCDAGAVPLLLSVVQDTAAGALASGGSGKRKKGKGKQQGGSKAAKQGGASGGDTKAAARLPGSAAAARGGGRGDSSGGGVPPPAFVLLDDPVAAADVALCNATGALHHLSFLDEAKQQLGASPHLPLLVALLAHRHTATPTPLAPSGSSGSSGGGHQRQGQGNGGHTYDNVAGLLWNVGLWEPNQERLAAAGAPRHLVAPVPPRWVTSGPACSPGPNAMMPGGATAAKPGAPLWSSTAAAGAGMAAAGAATVTTGVREMALRFVG